MLIANALTDRRCTDEHLVDTLAYVAAGVLLAFQLVFFVAVKGICNYGSAAAGG